MDNYPIDIAKDCRKRKVNRRGQMQKKNHFAGLQPQWFFLVGTIVIKL